MSVVYDNASVEAAETSQASVRCSNDRWKTVRRRLQLAEAGMWKQLFGEYSTAALRAEASSLDWPVDESVPSAEVSAASVQRRKLIAASKVKGGCVRTAAQLLKGNSLLPPCGTTAEQVHDLLVTELSPQHQADLELALAEAWEAGSGSKVRVTESVVRKRIDTLRAGAQPGASRSRNDFLTCIAAAPKGLTSLQRWCQLWADGNVPDKVAEIMTRQILRPIRKPNGKPRPIALLEVLFKLASGVLQDLLRTTPEGEGMDWNQYGAHPAGPELMLMVGQGMMNLAPHLAFASLDLSNAFGTASRAAMLRSAAKWCKGHCRFLCNIWRVPNVAWIESAPGQWTPISVRDGAFQGDTSSTPSFSRAMRMMVDAVLHKTQELNIWVHAASLVDDLLVVTEPQHLDEVVEIVGECARSILMTELNKEKCKAYVPQRDQQRLGPDPAITSIMQVEGGLPALGAAYGGTYESILGPFSVASGPARERLQVATHVAQECAKFAVESHAPATKQAAWCILQKCVARALQYDVRVLEPHEVKPLAAELDQVVADTARKLLGPLQGGWGEVQEAQLRWPASLSGMGMGSVSNAARAGRLACLFQCLPTARAHLRKIFPDASSEDILNAVNLNGAEAELAALRGAGIEISVRGTVASGAEARINLREEFEPARGVMGVVARALAEKERDAFLRRSEAAGTNAALMRDAARIHSCEGGAGYWVEAIPSSPGVRLNDAEFTTGIRHRMGLPQIPGHGTPCQLRSRSATNFIDDADQANTVCGQCLDNHLDHALCCNKGGGFYRVHGSVARALTSIAREADCIVYTEEVVPELLQGTPGTDEAVEARLDLHIWAHPPHPAEWWVDVTHHHPWASRYRTTIEPGRAAKDAEKQKHDRYGPGSGGVCVTPAAIESWGRLGPSFESLLAQLQTRWARTKQADASATAATGRRWYAEIGVAQVRALHVTCVQAVRGCSQEATA